MHHSAVFVAAAAALLSTVEAVPQYGYGSYGGGGCKPKYPTTTYAVMSTTLHPYGPTYTPAPNPNPCDWDRTVNIGLVIVAPGNSLDGKFVSTAAPRPGAQERVAVVSDKADITFRLMPGSGLVRIVEAGGSQPFLGATFPPKNIPGESVVPMTFAKDSGNRSGGVCMTLVNSAPFLTISNEQEWFACNAENGNKILQSQGVKQIFTSKTAGGRILVPDCQAIKLRLVQNHETGLIIPTSAGSGAPAPSS